MSWENNVMNRRRTTLERGNPVRYSLSTSAYYISWIASIGVTQGGRRSTNSWIRHGLLCYNDGTCPMLWQEMVHPFLPLSDTILAAL